MYPKSKDFDYRIFQECEGHKKYFNSELMDLINKITLSDRMSNNQDSSNAHKFSRKLKSMMICSILANMMDPRACFMQTLLGLACYSHGLRDKGIALLSTLGITSSAFHIREHGNLWAKLRSAIKEINRHAFWRVTFDNLDFRMKFAKCLSTGGHLKRMLHLLTSQVTFRNSVNNSSANISEPVKITEHFKLEHDDSEWKKYSQCTFQVTLDGTTTNEQTDQPLLSKIEQKMSHWTPESPDNVVYATVDEAHSGSIDDVGSYLVKERSSYWRKRLSKVYYFRWEPTDLRS